jgi:putative cardiolipin synthase
VIAGATPPEVARQRFDALAAAARPDVPLRPADVLDHTAVRDQLASGTIELLWASARLFVDNPAKLARGSDEAAYSGSVTEGALATLNAAHHEVTIVSPYFIPGPRGMAMMTKAMERGGRITVVTNSLGSTDEPLAYAGYARYRADLLRIGVTLIEIAPELSGRSGRFGDFGKSISRLHAKLAVIDDDHLFIGSMNLDHRSAAVNTEMGVLIHSTDIVADYHKAISSNRPDRGFRLQLAPDGHVQWLEYGPSGQDVVHDDEPGGHFWLRLQNWLLLPLVGEELL